MLLVNADQRKVALLAGEKKMVAIVQVCRKFCTASVSMALFCKVARLLLQTQSRDRGFCHRAEVVLEPGCSDYLACLEEHVNESGKVFLPMVKALIRKEMEQQRLAISYLTELLKKKTELRSKETLLLSKEKELRTKEGIEMLQVKGVNDTRGLYEMLQLRLAAICRKQGCKGVELWEEILKAFPALARGISGVVKVKNLSKLAVHPYYIYTTLSQHIHSGKWLAELKAQAGGAISFRRGPLTNAQVCILKCVADAAGLHIVEDSTRYMDAPVDVALFTVH